MSPSDLPWWDWLLSGLGALVVGYFLVVFTSETIALRTDGETPDGEFAVEVFLASLVVVGWLAITGGMGALMICVVRLFKWA